MADWHIQPRPGTDGFLANAMMKVIVDKKMHDVKFLNEQTHGWEEFVEKILPDYTLEKAEKLTGVPASDIRAILSLFFNFLINCFAWFISLLS